MSFLLTIPVRYYFTFIKVIVNENGLYYRNSLFGLLNATTAYEAT